MSRFNSKRFKDFSEPTINLTALIDVVFVILIIFIVIAPLLELDQIALADSSANNSKTSLTTEKNSPIAIHVRADNSVWLHDKKVSISDLSIELLQAKQTHPDAIPQLFHDRNAFFGTYQSIKNVVEEVGFPQMDIILKPT